MYSVEIKVKLKVFNLNPSVLMERCALENSNEELPRCSVVPQANC